MIKKVTTENEIIWAEMCADLWPRHTIDEFLTTRKEGKYQNEFLYLCEEEYVGFISLSIRNDYVEGLHQALLGT